MEKSSVVNKQDIRQKLLEKGFECYTFYLVTGSEQDICNKLNRRYPEAYFLTLRRIMHRSKDGNKWNEEKIMLNRYIFAFVGTGKTVDFLNEARGLLYLNNYGNEGKLTGDDKEYARWVLKNDGLLDISTAIIEKNLVKITGGPLLELQDRIIKYSRRNRNCLVKFNISNIEIETWLPFEWEEKNDS